MPVPGGALVSGEVVQRLRHPQIAHDHPVRHCSSLKEKSVTIPAVGR